MKKLFIFLLSCSLFASESTQEKIKDVGLVPYVDVSVGPLPLPLGGVGIGIRAPGHRVGFDTNIAVDPLIAKGELSVLFNINCKERSAKYLGIGCYGAIDLYKPKDKSIGPKISFGKNKLNKDDKLRFYEYSLIVLPASHGSPVHIPIPCFTIRWGLGF